MVPLKHLLVMKDQMMSQSARGYVLNQTVRMKMMLKKGQNIKVKKGPTKALLEDFPEYHSAQMRDELELYEQAQQQKKQLYNEPLVDIATIQNWSVKDIALALLEVKVVDPWTMPLVEFFHASTMLDKQATDTYKTLVFFNKRLFLLPLFYF